MKHFFRTKVDIISVVSTVIGLGATEVPTTFLSDLPCKWEWATGSEGKIYGKMGKLFAATMYCSIQDITQDMRVTYDGKTYEILNIINVNEIDRYLKIDLGLSE